MSYFQKMYCVMLYTNTACNFIFTRTLSLCQFIKYRDAHREVSAV